MPEQAPFFNPARLTPQFPVTPAPPAVPQPQQVAPAMPPQMPQAPPVPAPSFGPPAAQPQGFNLATMLPALLAGIKDPVVLGHAVAGLQNGRERARAQRESDEERQMRRSGEQADFYSRALQNSQQFEDPVAFEQWKQAITPMAKFYGVDPGVFTFSDQKRQAKAAKDAQATIDQLRKIHGPVVDDPEWQDTHSVDMGGKAVKVSALYQLAGAPALRNQQGALVGPTPKADVANTPEEQMAAALKAGDMETYNRLLKVRGDITAAGRAPGTESKGSIEQQYADAEKAGDTATMARLKRAANIRDNPPATGAGVGTTNEMARMVADGDMPVPLLSRRTANFNDIITGANRISIEETGKPFNVTKEVVNYNAALSFARSLNGPQMVRFQSLGQSVVNTIDEVQRLADELKQGGIQKWNAAKRGTILQVYGNTPQSQAAANYLVAVNTLKEEFANLANGGYAPTEATWALANQQINADYGLQDFTGSLGEVKRLINYRLQAPTQITPFLPGGGGGPAAAPVGPAAAPAAAPAPAAPAVQQWGRDPKTGLPVKLK